MVTTRSRGRATNANAPSPLQALPTASRAKTPKRKRIEPAPATPATPAPAPEKVNEEEDDEEDVGLFWQKDTKDLDWLVQAPISYRSPSLALSFLSPPPSETNIWRSCAIAAERRALIAESRLAEIEEKYQQLHDQHIKHIQHVQSSGRTGQVSANSLQTDIDMSASTNETEAQAEFLVGNDEAIALLRKIERSAKEPRGALPSEDATEDESVAAFTPPAQKASTPAPRPVSTPRGFLSRSFSAIKSRLGFSTPTAPTATEQPPATAPAPANRPAPGSFTEALSAPPTPVGERKQSRPKKPRQDPMIKLLTTGVESNDMPHALAWARQTIPDIFIRSDSSSLRTRLKKPVLVQDLDHIPSSKPWESGFGDPLGEMDDDEVAPVWAVYLAILADEEEPRRKKIKSHSEATMDDEDTPSLDELVAAGSAQGSSHVYDSHGMSASHLDLHPRRSMEPSPFFSPSTSHQQGNNIFREQQGQESALDMQTDREALHAATKKAVANHNPSQGSFGLDYDDDDEDSSMLMDNSECDGSSSHLWTQPPPPAPVPAHAPLPGGAVPDSPAPSQEQQAGEIERQRQKLMKHTPAKPSRLREAFVPSPSLLSEAGNASIMMGSPLTGPGLYNFEEMPDAEELGLTDDDWANVSALNNDPAYQTSQDAPAWADPIVTYDSEEETLSPE